MAINFTSKARIESLKKLTSGGEATIYEYDSKRVLKIYHAKVDLAKKEEKVRYFISIKNKLPQNVIGPEEIVTVQNKFVGYAMKKIVDAEDLHMLTKPKFLASNKFTNKDVLKIVTDFGKDLEELHKEGIIVGDISDYNFQISGKSNYFIDVDSWGVDGKFTPDAYSELFTCPDSYNPSGFIKFSKENENYNFAVLAFNILSRIHPFGGTYLPDSNLSTSERMKKKLSILGKHKKDIKIPKIIGSWKWISPELEKDFVEIFEQGKRHDITPKLLELLQNMKYCSVHDIYYYGNYNECPLCNENANVKAAPVITKVTQTANGPQLTVIFIGSDCAYILSDNHYLNKNGEAVHFESGRRYPIACVKRVEFSSDGNLVYVFDDETINVYDENNNLVSTIERLYKSNYLVRDKEIYFVDRGSRLVKIIVTKHGNMPKFLGQVYNPLFEISSDGKAFIVSTYPKNMIITTPDYNFEVKYSGKIREYTIKYDVKTGKWLFIYQLSNGKYRTMIFNKNVIEYDNNNIIYNSATLSNIDFYNNTIYDAADGKIIGTNVFKNAVKEFSCSIVDENSKLQFIGKGFKITNKSEIYNYC